MERLLHYRMNSACLPRVKYVDKVTVEPPHVHVRRRVEEYILYYVLSGEMHLQEGNRTYGLHAGDMLILDPNLEHYGTRSTTCTYFYVHFYHRQMQEYDEDASELKDELVGKRLESLNTRSDRKRDVEPATVVVPKCLHVTQTGAADSLTETLYRLRECHHSRLEHHPLKSSAIFLEALVTLSRELTSGFLYSDSTASTARSTRLVHELLSYFQDHYDRQITGRHIEERFQCNYDYLNRVFKKATGTTILAYLNDLRVFQARQMLSDGIAKASEVAEKCGFRDTYYFTKVFKQHTGTTPGAYARRNRV